MKNYELSQYSGTFRERARQVCECEVKFRCLDSVKEKRRAVLPSLFTATRFLVIIANRTLKHKQILVTITVGNLQHEGFQFEVQDQSVTGQKRLFEKNQKLTAAL